MDSYELEKIVKGVANHRRIDVMRLLRASPGLSVEEIAQQLRVEYKTLATHLFKLSSSGLVTKQNYGRRVEHTLTDRGTSMLKYLNGIS